MTGGSSTSRATVPTGRASPWRLPSRCRRATDPRTNEAAVLAVASEAFAGHDQVWVAGEHEGPFVKMLVEYRDEDGRAVPSGPADLRRYRDAYVRELGARGVAAQATNRSSRGLGFGETRKNYKKRQRLKDGMRMEDETEIAPVMARLQSGYDMLPFMAGLHPSTSMQLRPLPSDMQAIVEASPDYQEILPGHAPVWLQIASGNDAIELVVYRTLASGEMYVMAPIQGRNCSGSIADHEDRGEDL